MYDRGEAALGIRGSGPILSADEVILGCATGSGEPILIASCLGRGFFGQIIGGGGFSAGTAGEADTPIAG